MTFTITSDMVSASDVHEFYCDASDVGFPVGKWPARLSTGMGNGHDLLLHATTDEYAIYRQEYGAIVLRVFND